MGTLYIDKKNIRIKVDGNSLAFYSDDKRTGTVPIIPLSRVVVIGNVMLESSVISKLALAGISVIFLSGRSMKFCCMTHGSVHKNGLLRLAQYEKAQSDFSLSFSKELIRKKIREQRDFLREIRELRIDLKPQLSKGIETIGGIINSLEEGVPFGRESLMGLEGGASSAYFGAFTKLFPESLSFTKRTRRPPKDPVNAMLSLFYTMIHYEMVREIEVIGLDPTIGFYHKFEYGRESLACDFVEKYRTEADRFVYDLFHDRRLTARDFVYNNENSGCYLRKSSRKKFYPVFEEWISGLRGRFREDVRELARRLMDGKDALSQ